MLVNHKQCNGEQRASSRFSLALIAALTAAPPAAVAQADFSSPIAWVQVLAGTAAVRAITSAPTCPNVLFDGHPAAMTERAAPDADFQVRVCEASVPAGTKAATLAGKALAVPIQHLRRIAVVGDTGCRMKTGDGLDYGFQACHSPAKWPLAAVAEQIAAWKPDLIVHVGDYVYREQPCPPGDNGCAGSPITAPGQRWATWYADWFKPAAPMLRVAPVVLVRGDHENCSRAGPGWFRFLDPRAMQSCEDTTEPYAIDFDGLRLVLMDTVLADDTKFSPGNVRELYTRQFEKVRELSERRAWLLGHRPLWAVRPTDEAGSRVEPMNVTLQDALSHASSLPQQIELVLTGHIHLGEVISFKGGRPPQIVAGTGGTLLLPSITAELAGMQIDGAAIDHASVLSRYGFFTFEPQGSAWRVNFRDVHGETRLRCVLETKSTMCRE